MKKKRYFIFEKKNIWHYLNRSVICILYTELSFLHFFLGSIAQIEDISVM